MKIKYDSNRFIWQITDNQTTIVPEAGMTVEVVPTMRIVAYDNTGVFPKYRYLNDIITLINSYLDYYLDPTLWKRYMKYIRAELDEGNYFVVINEATYTDLAAIYNPLNRELRYVVDIDKLYLYDEPSEEWILSEVETDLREGNGISIVEGAIIVKSDGDSISVGEDGVKISDTITSKLDGIADNATKVEDSEINGNILINDEEVNVYTLGITNSNISEDTTLDSSRQRVTVDTTDNNIVITLPTAIGFNQLKTIKKMSENNKIIVYPQPGQKIDDEDFLIIEFIHSAATLASDGSNWFLV